MTVNTNKLLRMAEQITANMNYGGDTELVATKVADHINRFWDERMKSAIKDYASDHQDALSVELGAAIAKVDG